MAKDYKYEPVTADQVADEAAVDREAAKRAEDAGVVDAAYVDYEKALENYEQRSDVETLEQRRARQNATKFETAKFRREGVSAGLVTSEDVNADAAAKAEKADAPAKEAAAKK